MPSFYHTCSPRKLRLVDSHEFMDIIRDMAIERGVTVRQVEDEPGKGFFRTTIEEGGVKRQDRVPALHIEGGYEASQAYIQQQLDTGVPVVAYRAGERGQCEIAVNHKVVAVRRAREFSNSIFKESGWTDLDKPDYYSPHLIDSSGQGGNTPKIEFTGTNRQTSAPIKITVGFVR